MTTKVLFPTPDDWHLHIRNSTMMPHVLNFSARQFHHMLLMTNFPPPFVPGVNANLLREYRSEVWHSSDNAKRGTIHPVLYLRSDTTPEQIWSAYTERIIAAKFYPHGGTTHSGSGLLSPRYIRPETLQALQESGIVLCLHGEVVKEVQPDPLLREFDFIPELQLLVHSYPRLKVVVEHVSDRRMVQAVLDMPSNVAMTVTAHHPFLVNFDARHDPHCNCMPVAKTQQDRDCLARLILDAHRNPKIIFGSDSAPHMAEDKIDGAAGVWSAPVAIPVLWDHFDARGGTDKWEAFVAFTSINGARFYGRQNSRSQRGTITLRRERWQVPAITDFGVVPWKAGEVLDWRVDSMRWFGEPYPG